MWHISSPFCAEPEELRLLKERLAQVNCKCNLCNTCAPSLRQLSDPFIENIPYTKETETQSEGTENLQADNILKNTHCPSCCMTLSLLRGTFKTLATPVKVLKDEESETLASMFSVDKATDKGYMSQEPIPVLKNVALVSQNSSLTLCDFPTATSSEATMRNTKTNSHPPRRRCLDKVTFRNVHYEYPAKPHDVHNCLCLEDFIDTIRPPIN
ncbi:hypothetical protein PYW08_003224 [Mythimna loreyi]|uniref:Uncharacterized protein n=1 Tax=Mythimna loreyi TaxID=667449 RepID=A0ACC2QRK6_9NEOP|nr:hypothetical protein PYW08_003224 [Mythimna loreyi]